MTRVPSLSTLSRRRLLAWVAVFSLFALVVGIALPLTRYLERTLQNSRTTRIAAGEPTTPSPFETAAGEDSVGDVATDDAATATEAVADVGTSVREVTLSVAPAADATASTSSLAEPPPASPEPSSGPSPDPPRVPVRDDRDARSLIAEAMVRAAEFDLPGAIDLLRVAAERGNRGAEVGLVYLRGLVDACEAFREGGSAAVFALVQGAVESLGTITQGRRGSAEIARLPGASLVSATEIAGDLWLQVDRYQDARLAYAEAADRAGPSLRILAGLGRAASRLKDVLVACASYSSLLDTWGARSGLPAEIAAARAYVDDICGPTGS